MRRLPTPRYRQLVIIMVTLLLLGYAAPSIACPTIDGLSDFNCDRTYKMVFLGDSIVRGVGDVRYRNSGGYPIRIAERFPSATVVNLGIPGITTRRLYRYLLRRFAEPSHEDTVSMQGADLIGIGVGVNDFYDHADAGLTVRTIKRIATLVRKNLTTSDGIRPTVAIAKLTPTKRGFQRGFISSVNILLDRYKSSTLPVRLYFDRLDVALIGFDGLHPLSKGYTRLAAIAVRFILTDLQSITKRSDTDRDGVYDKFESDRYHTNPLLSDTDGDGISDGVEIFTNGTDPLVAE